MKKTWIKFTESDLLAFEITKTNISQNRYFIIAILFTRNSEKLKRYFRKELAKLIRNPKYKKLLDEKGEIKGVDLSETKKNSFYERVINNCKDDFEIGIIVLDNTYTTENFIKNHARTFNYILQKFFDNSFRHKSKYSKDTNDMHIILDEQNIATDAKYTLDEYLEQQFTIENPLCNHFRVRYADSKNHTLLQLIDFISNTFYRNIEKRDRTSIANVKMLLGQMCDHRIYVFSNSADTKLHLDE